MLKFVVARTMQRKIEQLFLFEFLNGVHFPSHAGFERFQQNLHRPLRSFAPPSAPVEDCPHRRPPTQQFDHASEQASIGFRRTWEGRLCGAVVDPPPRGSETCALRPTADICPRTLHENDGPIIELNRVTRLATRRLGKKISKILLRLMRLSDLSL